MYGYYDSFDCEVCCEEVYGDFYLTDEELAEMFADAEEVE